MVYLCFAFALAKRIFIPGKKECSLSPYIIVLSNLHSTGLLINSLEKADS